MIDTCYVGDVRAGLAAFIRSGHRARTCVTSPPYWGLRDYGIEGQLGLEATPDEYIDAMVRVFRYVRLALTDDGTLWLNMGDSYVGSHRGGDTGTSGLQGSTAGQEKSKHARQKRASFRKDRLVTPRSDVVVPGLKEKDLVGMPWRLALALQRDGWYLRRDVIWHKPNPMPESCKDRPTTAHEYLFLLAKSERYFYDWRAIAEPTSPDTHARYARGRSDSHKWADGGPGNQTIAKGFEHMRGQVVKPVAGWATGSKSHTAKDHARTDGDRDVKLRNKTVVREKDAGWRQKNNDSFDAAMHDEPPVRNKRSVWTIATEPFKGAHFATFPTGLVAPCVLAGSEPGNVVLDPFMGSGTTGKVAMELGRHWYGTEVNPEYVALQADRVRQFGLPLAVAVG